MTEEKTFTAFCQDANGTGTIWIDKVQATSIEKAATVARETCAQDWGCDPEQVHCLGLATGDVQIVHWEDLGDG